MGSGFSFGSYYPAQSFLHRLDARVKLAGTLAFIVLVLFADDVRGLCVVGAFVALLYALARIPLRHALKSLAPLLVIVLLASALNLFTVQDGAVLVRLGFLQISEGGLRQCAFIACRLLFMMMGASLLTLTTTTLDLTEAFEALLSPLARFGFPAHELGMILGLALRFMPEFATEFIWIYRSQISRGADKAQSPVRGLRMLVSLLVPLFVSVFRHAETLASAMDARCYHGKTGRTKLHPLRFARRDGLALACLGIFALCVIYV